MGTSNMQCSWIRWLQLFGVILLQVGVHGYVYDPLESELIAQAEKKADNVLKFSTRAFQKFILNNPNRMYDVYIFMTAEKFRDNRSLRLEVTRASFGKVAKSYTKQKAREEVDGQGSMRRVFFTQMDLVDGQDVMTMMRVEYIPWIARVAAEWKARGSSDDAYRLEDADTLSAKDNTNMPWAPKVVAKWVEERSHIELDDYIDWSIVRQKWFPAALVGGLLVASPLLVWLLTSPIIRNPYVQCTGALTVYGLSTSGFMNMLIKQMPFAQYTPKGPVYFYEGNQTVQLCAEGFIMGGGYMMIGISIAVLTWVVPRIPYRIVKVVLSLLIYTAVYSVSIFLFRTYYWKTGFVPTTYLLPAK